MEEIENRGNCLQCWGTFLWRVPELLLRGGGSRALAAGFTLEPCTRLAANAVVIHLQTPITLELCLCTRVDTGLISLPVCWVLLWFSLFCLLRPFFFLFVVCRISKQLFTRRRLWTLLLLLCLYYHSFMCMSLAGGPGAKMESTWFCDFTIEIKKSNMTEEACCLWNYGFHWRTSLPNHN